MIQRQSKLRIIIRKKVTIKMKFLSLPKDIILGLYFWILMVLTLPVYLVYLPLQLISEKATRRYLYFFIHGWARHVLAIAGARLEINGWENIPSTLQLAVVSNHQSYFDIPLIIAIMPFLPGFVAKKELGRVPLLNLWMRPMQCVLIDRKKPSHSLEKIRQRVEKAKRGYPLVLFPEGTRSRGANLGRFKTGSLQMLYTSGLAILPVSISGSYHLLEEYNSLRSGPVRVTIHSPIYEHQKGEQDYRDLTQRLREIIRSGLD